MEVKCPYCGAEGQVVEDMGDSFNWLFGQCDMCGQGFSFDSWLDEYYDDYGCKITPNSSQRGLPRNG